MIATESRASKFLPSRFAWLMGLYADNFHRLQRLFGARDLQPGHYRSSVDDGLDVLVTVEHRHPYTVDMVVSYASTDRDTGRLAPSAQVRLYLDANVAEVQHCHPGKQLWQVLGPWPPAAVLSRHRLRMATFLNRWVVYLTEQGHSRGTLERLPPAHGDL